MTISHDYHNPWWVYPLVDYENARSTAQLSQRALWLVSPPRDPWGTCYRDLYSSMIRGRLGLGPVYFHRLQWNLLQVGSPHTFIG